MRAVFVPLAVALALALWAPASAADESAPAPADGAPKQAAAAGETLTTPMRLRHDVLLDLVSTAVLGGLLVTWRSTRGDVVSSSCTICDGTTPGQANAVDDFFHDAFKRRDTQPAKTASDVLSYGVAPAMGLVLTYAAAAADRRASEAPLNGLLVLEASLAGVAVDEALSAFLRRERPSVHALEGDAKASALGDASSLDSFPAGSTAAIMAITAATATVATQRGYRLAPLVWIVGTTLGLTSTYLGIAADENHFTDHVAGAAVGLGVGAAIPLLFHHRAEPSGLARVRWLRDAMVSSRAVPGGRVVGLGWSF